MCSRSPSEKACVPARRMFDNFDVKLQTTREQVIGVKTTTSEKENKHRFETIVADANEVLLIDGGVGFESQQRRQVAAEVGVVDAVGAVDVLIDDDLRTGSKDDDDDEREARIDVGLHFRIVFEEKLIECAVTIEALLKVANLKR